MVMFFHLFFAPNNKYDAQRRRGFVGLLSTFNAVNRRLRLVVSCCVQILEFVTSTSNCPFSMPFVSFLFKVSIPSIKKLLGKLLIMNHNLGGGFNQFSFSPLPGEDSHFDDWLKPPTIWRGWDGGKPPKDSSSACKTTRNSSCVVDVLVLVKGWMLMIMVNNVYPGLTTSLSVSLGGVSF